MNLWCRNHLWGPARHAAMKRDLYACRGCGRVMNRFHNDIEVNHVEPRDGLGYGPGCHHHQDNLETLCHACHVAVTTLQRAIRSARRKLRRLGYSDQDCRSMLHGAVLTSEGLHYAAG